jgi:hypothetical protein
MLLLVESRRQISAAVKKHLNGLSTLVFLCPVHSIEPNLALGGHLIA